MAADMCAACGRTRGSASQLREHEKTCKTVGWRKAGQHTAAGRHTRESPVREPKPSGPSLRSSFLRRGLVWPSVQEFRREKVDKPPSDSPQGSPHSDTKAAHPGSLLSNDAGIGGEKGGILQRNSSGGYPLWLYRQNAR
jgi:hypothetical protein